MGTPGTLNLIDIWQGKEIKDEYRGVHSNASLYRKVSAQMVLRGYMFSPDQCKSKMDLLASEFKGYVNSLKRTGQAAPPPWDYYEPLRPILEDMVTVTPEATYCVGASNSSTVSPHVGRQPDNNSNRTGRARPPAASKQEERKAMLQMMLDSRRDMIGELKEIAAAFSKTNK